jgi:hypothetical protein
MRRRSATIATVAKPGDSRESRDSRWPVNAQSQPSADQVRMADLEGKTSGPSRPQHFEGHHSHPAAMPQDSVSSRESRSTPSNYTRTCNKLPDVYM